MVYYSVVFISISGVNVGHKSEILHTSECMWMTCLLHTKDGTHLLVVTRVDVLKDRATR